MCEPTTIDITQKLVRLINLNDCKPGQKLRRRDGKIVAYRSKNKGNVGNTYGHIVDHNKDTYDTHTDTGLVFASSTNPPDIVEILPLEEEIPILDKVTTVDEAEFQMWDKANEEYYGVVTSAFARKLEDNNRKLITENTGLFNRIKQLEKENNSHLAKIEHSRLEINRLITTSHKQVEVIDSREEELRAANKAIEKYKDRIEKLSETAIKRQADEQRLRARGWYKETEGAYKGNWVNPANGCHYTFMNAITYL
jgi:hypothetical protein